MRVRDIGEFTLIERLREQLAPAVRSSTAVPLGIGDDAALWSPEPGYQVVVSTDALVEGVHFRLDWTDWRSLGHKMLAVNISDIAAMGAVPSLATIVLGLTGDEAVVDLESLYQGANDIAAAYGVTIAGGDIVRSPGGIFLSVSLLGQVASGWAVGRDGACEGDLVVVSGTLGASAAGMHLLAARSDAATADLLVASHLRPVPRVALGSVMHESGVTAAMDLSDGLLGDLRKILAASSVSAEIDLDLVPVLPAVRALFPDSWRNLATRGGEDYELLMTIPEHRYAELHRRAGDAGATVTVVGRVLQAVEGQPRVLLAHGEGLESETGAFDHFAREDR